MNRVPRLPLFILIAVSCTACSKPGGNNMPAGTAAPAPAESRPASTASVSGASAEAAPTPAPETSRPADAAPAAYREVTIPAGTSLAVDLRTSVASDTSQVEDPVRGALRRAVLVGGVEVLPEGTVVSGHVTRATRSARVKGRSLVAFQFTSLDAPGAGGRAAIRTSSVVRQAAATKAKDATKIGVGAAGGAALGAIFGGGSGAAKGAAVGGAAGTGLVLSTRGDEVRVPVGTNLVVRLTAPVTVRVRR